MVDKPAHWTARAVRIFVACALGLLTARSSDFPPAISSLFLILVLFVFFGALLLMELVPAWRRDFDSMKLQRLFRVLFVLAVFLLIYVLIALRQIQGALGGRSPFWLFAIYIVLFLACAELFKVGFGRRRVD